MNIINNLCKTEINRTVVTHWDWPVSGSGSGDDPLIWHPLTEELSQLQSNYRLQPIVAKNICMILRLCDMYYFVLKWKKIRFFLFSDKCESELCISLKAIRKIYE